MRNTLAHSVKGHLSIVQKSLWTGYYADAGLNVSIIPGGGDIGETTSVYTGQVDFGVTWVANLIAANAGGVGLKEIAQVYQRSGLVLVHKTK